MSSIMTILLLKRLPYSPFLSINEITTNEPGLPSVFCLGKSKLLDYRKILLTISESSKTSMASDNSHQIYQTIDKYGIILTY
jgi:hypothetical protein